MKRTVLLLGVLMAMTMCASAGGALGGEMEKDAEAGEKEAAAVLHNALKNAKASGDEQINIFLDEEEGLVQENDYVIFSYVATTSAGKQVTLTADGGGGRLGDYAVGGSGDAGGETRETAVVKVGDGEALGGIGKTVEGMREGDTGHLNWKAEDAFGERDEGKVKVYDRIKKVDKIIKMTPEEYYATYKEFPVLNSTISFAPYADAEITSVEKGEAVLSLIIENREQHFEDTFGETVVSLDEADGVVTIELKPVIGKVFNDGRIAAVDGDKFSVDYNHPLAGEDIDIEFTVLNIKKPSSFAYENIEWYEDYETAVEASSETGRPMVLLLYADWCQYCEKMLGGTFKDPWVRFFSNKFVWLKIDSSKNREFYRAFEQSSYPTTVLIDTDGNIIKKLRGYKKAKEIQKELIELYNRDHASA